MSDLRDILPRFPVAQYSNLLAVLEKHRYTTTDVIVLEAAEIGKRTKLPLLDLQRLANNVLAALHKDLGVLPSQNQPAPTRSRHAATPRPAPGPLNQLPPFCSISTLSPALDAVLGGGIPAGYVTEVTGESGAGKTQFMLSLLLAVQLPPPYGLGRPAIYISTEATLATTRLDQILSSNPVLKEIRRSQWADGTFLSDLDGGSNQQLPKSLPPGTGPLTFPSLDGILSTTTPDLESQEHILTYQVPVEIARRNAGLLVLDSVAANYRAEFNRGGGAKNTSGATPVPGSAKNDPQSMGARSHELVKLGFLLHDLARRYNMAVVVSNQVSDRIIERPTGAKPAAGQTSSSSSGMKFPDSPLASRSRRAAATTPSIIENVEPSSPLASFVPRSSIDTSHPLPLDPAATAPDHWWAEQLQLDHQQRFFSGWGDDPDANFPNKTPSLGLVWTTQVACRLALIKLPNHWGGGGGEGAEYLEDEWERDEDGALIPKAGTTKRKAWRRWMKVAFAPHVPGTGQGLSGAVEYDITMGGLRGIEKVKGKKDEEKQNGNGD